MLQSTNTIPTTTRFTASMIVGWNDMTTFQKALYKAGVAFLTPRGEMGGGDTRFGICDCLYYQSYNKKVGMAHHNKLWDLTRTMGYKMNCIATRNEPEANWLPEHDQIRGMFCLLLAYMPNKDFEELFK